MTRVLAYSLGDSCSKSLLCVMRGCLLGACVEGRFSLRANSPSILQSGRSGTQITARITASYFARTGRIAHPNPRRVAS